MTNTNCNSHNPESVEQLFHWNTEPEDRTKTCEELEKFKADTLQMPNGIIDYFVQLFQDYFSNPNNIENDSLRGIVLNKDILVSSMANFDTDKSGVKPCIYVEFSGVKNQSEFAQNNQFDYNSNNGSKMYYTRQQMGFTFYVLGNTLKETLLLAEEVYKLCLYYQQPIQQNAGWLRFQVAEMQKAKALDTGTTEGYIAPISVLLITHCSWYLFDESPRLKRVVFSVTNKNDSLDTSEY